MLVEQKEEACPNNAQSPNSVPSKGIIIREGATQHASHNGVVANELHNIPASKELSTSTNHCLLHTT